MERSHPYATIETSASIAKHFHRGRTPWVETTDHVFPDDCMPPLISIQGQGALPSLPVARPDTSSARLGHAGVDPPIKRAGELNVPHVA